MLFFKQKITKLIKYICTLIRQTRLRDPTHLSWDGDIRSNLSIEKVPFIRQLPTIADVLAASTCAKKN